MSFEIKELKPSNHNVKYLTQKRVVKKSPTKKTTPPRLVKYGHEDNVPEIKNIKVNHSPIKTVEQKKIIGKTNPPVVDKVKPIEKEVDKKQVVVKKTTKKKEDDTDESSIISSDESLSDSSSSDESSSEEDSREESDEKDKKKSKREKDSDLGLLNGNLLAYLAIGGLALKMFTN